MKPFPFILGLLLIGGLFAGLAFQQAEAGSMAQASQEGEVIFQQKCASCHTIGGGALVGPDLEGVTARRELPWLQEFVANPGSVIDSGDPVAAQLLAEYNNVRMPDMGLTDAQVSAVLAYLEAPGAGAQAPPSAALPPGGAQAGQKLFTGETRLQNGGAPCIACHTVGGTGFLEGGALGPDLTHVIQRYGEAGLASSLNQIAFPTMQGPFLNRPLTPQEQADLVAYFQWSDTQAPVPAVNSGLLILGIGLFGALLLFGLMAFAWPRQRESLASRLRRNKTTGDRARPAASIRTGDSLG